MNQPAVQQENPAPMAAPGLAGAGQSDLDQLLASPQPNVPLAQVPGAPPMTPAGGAPFLGVPLPHDRFLNGSQFRESDFLEALAGKRIVHMPMEIAGNMARITKHMRAKGVDATSVNYYGSWLNYKCDINLNLQDIPQDQQPGIIDRFARQAMDKYDIFHFHFAKSMYPDLRDLDEIKQRGKKILFSFWGSDMRSPEWLLYNHARFLGYDPPLPYSMNMQQYQTIRHINAYADVMLGPPFIPRYIYFTGDADLEEWDPKDKAGYLEQSPVRKEPGKVYFLHAPSNSLKKGTPWVERLIGECQAQGLPVEPIYVSGVPHDQVKSHYAAADFAIDQVTVGTFGLFGAEMMSWEIPVLVYSSEWFHRFKSYPPVISVTRDNFVSQVRRCVEIHRSGQAAELGRRARRWALAHRQMKGGAVRQYLAMYGLLAQDLSVPHHVNPTWHKQELDIIKGRKSEFHRWMREMGVYQDMGVNIESYDQRLYT